MSPPFRRATVSAGTTDSVPRRGGRRGEDGYVLALVAVALVPLVAVTALSVDFAVWQGEGAELQRAADAAALAAVPGLPSLPEATSRARSAAAANGVVHGEGGANVVVEATAGARARVTVSTPNAPRVFSLPFLGQFGIERTAVAEWAEPVSLGSSRNFLGTGSLAGSRDPHLGLPGVPETAAERYWLAINGPCASREQGDWLTAVSEANFVSPNPPSGPRPWRGCTSAADPEVNVVRPEGPSRHLVAVRVPHGYPGGPFTVQLFDASHCAASPMDTDATFTPFATRFTLLGPASSGGAGDQATLGSTRLVTGSGCGDDPVAPRGYECGTASWSRRWCNLATVSTPQSGDVYLLAVEVDPVNPTARHGVNAYGVRVINGSRMTTGVFTPCSTDPQDGAVSYQPETCIAVEGREWLSVTTTGGGGDASFILAEVGAQHGGSTMEVVLFDIGEGTDAVELLDPTGAAVGFTWEVVTALGDVPPTGGVRGVVAPGGALDVGGGGTGSCGGGHLQRGPGRLSGSKYNDRLLRLTVQLPDDPALAWGGRQWWRVRYRACGSRLPTDRTSWAVWIEGQPVRLIG